MSLNGSKKWLVGIATAVLLGYSGWVGMSVVNLLSRAAVAEAETEALKDWLRRIDGKLDELLARRR